MLFSSTVFLFQFLPCAFLIYFGIWWFSKKLLLANIALSVISLSFYFIGNGYLVFLLIASIGGNYAISRAIAVAPEPRQRSYLVAGIIANLAVLGLFKYATFATTSLAGAAALVHLPLALPILTVALPVGISFYTFMSISYLIEVSGSRQPARSIADYAVYLSLFPHLIAGPIVRYSELRGEIAARTVSGSMFVDGIYRFSIGLARKSIIADSLAVQSDRIFALPSTELTASLAWLGAVCYAVQIFYDFSGYTDMAIGLAKMLGFHFPENFDQPYAAASITEFWRRWHMTLTRWFRDYLYIPLGGNRKGPVRTYLNLFTVFVLCGLWHGAAWTFVAWGMYHGILLVIERLLAQRLAFRARGPLFVAITFVLITIGWVFFRAPSIGAAFGYLAAMFGLTPAQSPPAGSLLSYSPVSTAFYVIAGLVIAIVPAGFTARAFNARSIVIAKSALAIAALILSIAYISESTFRPFIYYRF